MAVLLFCVSFPASKSQPFDFQFCWRRYRFLHYHYRITRYVLRERVYSLCSFLHRFDVLSPRELQSQYVTPWTIKPQVKKQRTIDRSGSDIVTPRGNLCAGIVFSIIDHPAVHTDKSAYRRPDQAGPPEDHDHLHDRRPLQGYGGENDTLKGRERAVLPVAVPTTSQVSVLMLCCPLSIVCTLFYFPTTFVFCGKVASDVFVLLSPNSYWNWKCRQ